MIVVLETLKTDNSDIEDSTKCRTTSSDTPTLSGYQNVSNKTFQSSYAIEEPTKFPTYKTDKKTKRNWDGPGVVQLQLALC